VVHDVTGARSFCRSVGWAGSLSLELPADCRASSDAASVVTLAAIAIALRVLLAEQLGSGEGEEEAGAKHASFIGCAG
jgi:hypothetical protein